VSSLKSILIVAITLSVVACSNTLIYNAAQDNQGLECGQLPQIQFERCMKELDTTYEEHAQEWQAAR